MVIADTKAIQLKDNISCAVTIMLIAGNKHIHLFLIFSTIRQEWRVATGGEYLSRCGNWQVERWRINQGDVFRRVTPFNLSPDVNIAPSRSFLCDNI